MCGRYYLATLPEELADFFSIVSKVDFGMTYNAAPTQLMPIIRFDKDGDREIAHAKWGLIPRWAKDKSIGNKLINARGETVAEKPAFRYAFGKQPCLIPASGFYEWKREGDGKQPYAIYPNDGPLLALGGIWERWRSPDDEVIDSYSIITKPADSFMQSLHHRMPVMLNPDQFDAWLDPSSDQRQSLIDGESNIALASHPVSKEVNNPRNNHDKLTQALKS